MDELTVSLSQIKKIVEKSEAVGAEDVSFSFVIASLFPAVWDHIKQRLLEERIAGYNEAMEQFQLKIEDNLK